MKLPKFIFTMMVGAALVLSSCGSSEKDNSATTPTQENIEQADTHQNDADAVLNELHKTPESGQITTQSTSGDSYASKYEGKKCSVKNSSGVYCNCSGCYCGNWDASKCNRCGHRSDQHTR